MIRAATVNDLDELFRLENICFETDRMSRRSLHHMITRAKADILVSTKGKNLGGYVAVLYHSGTSLARLYSIAVDPLQRGRGLGEKLLKAAEQAARGNECVSMRLEIRHDNHAAGALYKRMGYRQFGMYHNYYNDRTDALRMEKSLVSHYKPAIARVPYYEQTLDFTCGPAAIMMAMRALDKNLHLDRKLEIRLWREATTVFMTSGHGGCGPYGMALSAYRRGFDVEIFVKDDSAMFVDSVRSKEKKEVIRITQEDFLDEIHKSRVKLHYESLDQDTMEKRFSAGSIPIMLISSYRIYREKFPHWVVVTGFDDRFIYVHDPYVDHEKGKRRIDCMNMPILKREFAGMMHYGKSAQRAALLVSTRKIRQAGSKA